MPGSVMESEVDFGILRSVRRRLKADEKRPACWIQTSASGPSQCSRNGTQWSSGHSATAGGAQRGEYHQTGGEGGYLVEGFRQRRGGGGVGDAGAARAAGAGNRCYRTRHMRAKEVESAEGCAALHLGVELGRHCQYGSWRQSAAEAVGVWPSLFRAEEWRWDWRDKPHSGARLNHLDQKKSRPVAAKGWCSLSSLGHAGTRLGRGQVLVVRRWRSWCWTAARARRRARRAGRQRRVNARARGYAARRERSAQRW
jgi:hypothetical protein